MTDIYKNRDAIVRPPSNGEGASTIEERNQFPTEVDPSKDVAFPRDKQRSTVDFFQTHPHKEDFGTTSGLFSMYDPTNPDRQLMDVVEQEIISVTSPPFKYYKLLHHLQNIDPLYGEAVSRSAYNDPIIIFGNYDDPSPIIELSKYGMNQAESLDIWFNLNYLYNNIGDILKEGDVLQSYDGKLWEVMSSIVIDESLWRPQHNNVKVIKLQSEGIILPDLGSLDRGIEVVRPNR